MSLIVVAAWLRIRIASTAMLSRRTPRSLDAPSTMIPAPLQHCLSCHHSCDLLIWPWMTPPWKQLFWPSSQAGYRFDVVWVNVFPRASYVVLPPEPVHRLDVVGTTVLVGHPACCGVVAFWTAVDDVAAAELDWSRCMAAGVPSGATSRAA